MQDGGMIVVGKRDPSLDRSLESAWHELRVRGTRYLKSNVTNGRILSMNLRAKSENIAGLQLADLVVSPIGRHVLGKRDYEDWDVICEKLRRNHRDVAEGYGLVVLPKIKKRPSFHFWPPSVGPRYAVTNSHSYESTPSEDVKPVQDSKISV